MLMLLLVLEYFAVCHQSDKPLLENLRNGLELK